MLTWTPDNFASAYSCNLCGISSQILSHQKDENGNLMYREDNSPVMVNDEPAASAELGEHVKGDHPETLHQDE